MTYASYIGRTDTQEDTASPRDARAMAATLGTPEPHTHLPPLWHWMLFAAWAPTSELGADGHPRRGGFLPELPHLPRRMWAGGRVRFLHSLPIATPMQRTSTILAITEKSGASGPLVFVTIRHIIIGPTGPCLEEEQDLVYRGTPAEAVKLGDPAPPINAIAAREVLPSPVLLFRYSALTGNGHRIHYDADYARSEEGYPCLVVHGPLQATWMAALAASLGRLHSFSYRGRHPAFAGTPLQVEAWHDGGLRLRTRDAAGAVCMTAEAA